MGLVLTDTACIEKRLSRFPQLYSRVGFAHEHRPLQRAELLFVLKRHWKGLGLELDEAEFTDAQAIAAIARITGAPERAAHARAKAAVWGALRDTLRKGDVAFALGASTGSRGAR